MNYTKGWTQALIAVNLMKLAQQEPEPEYVELAKRFAKMAFEHGHIIHDKYGEWNADTFLAFDSISQRFLMPGSVWVPNEAVFYNGAAPDNDDPVKLAELEGRLSRLEERVKGILEASIPIYIPQP